MTGNKYMAIHTGQTEPVRITKNVALNWEEEKFVDLWAVYRVNKAELVCCGSSK